MTLSIPQNVGSDDRQEIERLLGRLYPSEQAANEWLTRTNTVWNRSPNDLLRDDAEPGVERMILSYLKQCRMPGQ